MPELPDVEHFTKQIKKTSLNKKITGVWVAAGERSLLKKSSVPALKKALTGSRFTDARRRGKYSIIDISQSEKKLIMHFGMTGSVQYARQDAPRDNNEAYTKFAFQFANGYELRWINRRKLGALYLVDNPNDIESIADLGPEPLSLSRKHFIDILEKNRSRSVKHLLMDQESIAGIGNVYSDEILFQAGIKPSRTISKLSQSDANTLYTKMQYVLREAAKRHAQPSRMPDTWLTPHRGKGSGCPRDNGTIKKTTVNSRSTYYCTKHQS